MIKRTVETSVKHLSKKYPVITITGPRQSGKTTLCQVCFKNYFYCSLENPNIREFATKDPKGFLNQSKKMVIDEVQHVPSLVSYIQEIVDKNRQAGQFILTGSYQLQLNHLISQSLAGRTALITLLPFSLSEIGETLSISKLIYRGFYPRIIDQKLNPTQALSFYTNTYLQKDVRNIKEIKNFRQFEIFLKLCASLVGQIINKNQLSNDVGVDSKTIDAWLSVLQASYIIFLLSPHFKNFKKRLVKRPKLYFYDVGLASYLLSIQKESHVLSHPLKGFLFENLMIIEKLKQKLNKIKEPNLYYFRDHIGNEVDLVEDMGNTIVTYEIKMSQTINSSLFKGLNFYKKLNKNNKKSYLIYTGSKKIKIYQHECLPYTEI